MRRLKTVPAPATPAVIIVVIFIICRGRHVCHDDRLFTIVREFVTFNFQNSLQFVNFPNKFLNSLGYMGLCLHRQWRFSKRLISNKKYVLSNSESVQCNFFIFDHVTFIQFKICCCVQHFIESGWFFTEIWRYIDFQNGGRPPSWNCLPPYKTTHEVSVAGRSCLSKFMSSDTQIWRYSYLNFSHIWLEMPIQVPKIGVLGDFGPLNVIIHHRDPQKSHPCVICVF